MGYFVLYAMKALDGQGDAFAFALQDLAGEICALPGGVTVQILRDTAETASFVFIENWPSQAAYEAGAKLLPGSAFAPLKPLLDGKPLRRVLTQV